MFVCLSVSLSISQSISVLNSEDHFIFLYVCRRIHFIFILELPEARILAAADSDPIGHLKLDCNFLSENRPI